MADQPTQISVDQISVEKGPNLPATPTPEVQAQNEAPLQVAANNAPSPALTATGAAPVVEAETYQVVVKAPEGHGMLAYLVGPGADIILTDIDINNATLAQEGGNLRITLPGGGEILLIDYVNSAHDSHTIVTTAEGNLPAQKLLEAVNLASAEQDKNANVQPAEGPAGHGAEGGFIPPTILGTGVGEGAAVFSQVIGPYALPVWTDGIKTETPVTEKGVAAAPVNSVDAVDDFAKDIAAHPITINVLANDFDPQGDSFSITSHTNAAHGTLVQNANGTFTYTADAGFQGVDSFTYTITDSKGATDTATVTINVSPNTVVAVDDSGNVMSRQSVTINVLANDFDPQGDSFSITAHTNPSHGSVVQNANGTFTYTADAGFQGVDHFTYTITDQYGATSTATVTINVTNGNSVVAVDDSATDIAAHPITINVLANDYDPQGDSFSITSHTNTSHGTLVQNANGTFTYTADAGFQGVDSFTYTITDQYGATSTATVRIDVGPNTVVAVDDSATDISRQPVTINVLANDFDPQGDSFSITSHTNTSHGTLVQNANGTFTYTADAGFQGVDSFTYTITDQYGATSTATVRIDVTNGNTVVAVDDSATDIAAHPVTINVLANDYDPQGDSFSITSHTNTSHGTLVQNANGTFTYTADAGFQGVDNFTYTITDQYGATSTATVTIHVGPNTVVAVDDSATDKAGIPVTINVLANDFDPQGDSFSITSHTNPAHGTLVQNANGTFTYTADVNYQGADSFTYTITDQYGATSTATVRINVAEGNTVVAVNDTATDIAAHPITINVLANDYDPQGDSFSITSHTNTSHGTLVQNANGTFTYTAFAGYQGTDSFTYTITDSKGATDTATVTINVGPNTVVAVDDSATDTATHPVTINVLANDYDPQGDSFSITSHTSPAHGTLVQNANGTFTYTAVAGYHGADSFTYTITDQYGATSTATVHITVNENNTVVAVDDSAADTAAHPVTINVLANDYDPQGDSFHITSHTNPAHGALVQNANGTFTYTAVAGYQGTDSFTYTITDSKGATDTATVNIVVHPNTVVAVNDSATANAFGSVKINVLANDYDPQGDSFHIDHIVSGPSKGSVHINSDGTITYKAANNFGNYNTSFVYEIVDQYGATSQATVSIHVNPYIIVNPGGNDNGQSGGSGGGGGGDCPLTIDLNGDGIQITPLGQSAAHFDLNGDGIAEHTAWVSGSDDAILALDANHNGTIDGINEVFGGAGVDGYTELARLDANHDGVINAADADFAKLDLWLDANHDGVTQAGELHTLADFGITEISLQTYQTALMYGDAYINDESTVTFADGHTTTSGSVFYTNDANGTITGSNGDDVLVYNNTATVIDGGNGLDVLKVLTASDITVDHNLVHGVEAIDTQNNGADHITINANDVLQMSDTGTIMLTGDAVDHVTITNATQGADVVQNGTTFASYTSSNGGTILVDTAMHVTTDHHQP